MIRLLKILLVLIVLIVGGAIGAFYLTPSSVIANQAASAVRDATGRELVIEGEIQRSLYPTLSITTGPVRLSNADWAAEPDLFRAESVHVGLTTLPLISGAVAVEEIRIIGPEAHLEVDETGRQSWAFETQAGGDSGASDGGGGGDSASDAADEALDFSLASAIVENGLLTFTDRQTGQVVRAENVQLTAALPALDQTLTADGSAVINGETATLAAALDNPASLQAGENTLADLALGAPGLSVEFDGSVTPPTGDGAPRATGALSASLDADPQTTAWLRQALPPDFADVGAVSLEGRFDASEAALDVDLSGDALFKGQETAMTLTAAAGAGWMEGETPADIDASLANGLMDVGFEGRLGGNVENPVIQGAYRARVPNAPALIAWAGAAAPEGSPLEQLGAVDITGRADVTRSAALASLDGAVRYGGRDVSVSGRVDGDQTWADGGAITSDVRLTSAGLFRAAWDGTVRLSGEGPSAVGGVEFGSEALRDFVDWVGAGPLEAPAGELETVDFSGQLDFAPGQVTLDEIDLTLDDKNVTGSIATRTDGPRPSVEATLVAGALDLRPFTRAAGGSGGGSGGGAAAGGGSGGGGAAPQRGWSAAPLDLGVLQLVDADIDLTTAGLVTDVIRIGDSRVVVELANGRLATTVDRLGLYGGGASGTMIVDSNGTPAIDIDMQMSGVQLRPMLTDTSQIDWLEGTGFARVDVDGAGGSMQQLMRSLNGAANIDFRDGAIVGYNLAAIVRNITSLGTASTEVQRTDFAELGGSFTIRDGVAYNEDFAMSGPLVRLTGSGAIDIGAQTLNYRAVPKAVATLQGQGGSGNLRGIAFPLLITGPWEDPSITPDLTGGALESVEGLLADPEGAAAFLGDLTGDLGGDAGQIIEGVLGGGDGGSGAAGQILEGVLGGGGDSGGGTPADAAGQLLEGVLGGGGGGGDSGGAQEEAPNPGRVLRGLFGN